MTDTTPTPHSIQFIEEPGVSGLGDSIYVYDEDGTYTWHQVDLSFFDRDSSSDEIMESVNKALGTDWKVARDSDDGEAYAYFYIFSYILEK